MLTVFVALVAALAGFALGYRVGYRRYHPLAGALAPQPQASSLPAPAPETPAVPFATIVAPEPEPPATQHPRGRYQVRLNREGTVKFLFGSDDVSEAKNFWHQHVPARPGGIIEFYDAKLNLVRGVRS